MGRVDRDGDNCWTGREEGYFGRLGEDIDGRGQSYRDDEETIGVGEGEFEETDYGLTECLMKNLRMASVFKTFSIVLPR